MCAQANDRCVVVRTGGDAASEAVRLAGGRSEATLRCCRSSRHGNLRLSPRVAVVIANDSVGRVRTLNTTHTDVDRIRCVDRHATVHDVDAVVRLNQTNLEVVAVRIRAVAVRTRHVLPLDHKRVVTGCALQLCDDRCRVRTDKIITPCGDYGAGNIRSRQRTMRIIRDARSTKRDVAVRMHVHRGEHRIANGKVEAERCTNDDFLVDRRTRRMRRTKEQLLVVAIDGGHGIIRVRCICVGRAYKHECNEQRDATGSVANHSSSTYGFGLLICCLRIQVHVKIVRCSRGTKGSARTNFRTAFAVKETKIAERVPCTKLCFARKRMDAQGVVLTL